MKETDIKYLAGLLDADGSFMLTFSNSRVYLRMSLDLSTGIDKDCKYSQWLSDKLEVTPCIHKREGNAKGVMSIKIVVQKRSTIEKIVPRLLKYLVIKGKHLEELYKVWQELRGRILEEDAIEKLKQFSKDSRKNVGPVKPKTKLPRAYVAGYLDGDGSYIMKKSSGTYNVNCVAHIDDRIVADLLHKQYGGHIYYQENWIRWRRPLGRTNKSFAVPFLKDMHRHSRLKKWKIEQFLNHHHSQRLSGNRSKDQAIV